MDLRCFCIALACLTVAVSTPGTRNSQPGCAIVINEISYGSASGSFVEIAKLCPAGVPANKKIKLGGFLLLLVDTSTLKLETLVNLHRRTLTILPYDPTDDAVPNKIRHSKLSLPSSNKKQEKVATVTESAVTPSVEPALNFDVATVPCELDFDCAPENRQKKTRRSLQNHSTPTTLFRKRRHLQDKQRNVRGLYVVKLDTDFDRKKSYAILLLKLPNKKAGVVEGRKNYNVGDILADGGLSDIQAYLHDYLILNPSSLSIDQQKVLNFLTESQPLAFIDTNPEQILVSVSKCDSLISAVDPSGFVITTTPTPLEPNHCKKYQLQPFSFRGSNFNVQAKKLLANAVVGLRDYKNDATWQKMNEVEATSALLNVHQSTVYRLMNEFQETGVLSPPKKVARICPITDLSTEMKKTLYDSIVFFFKKNEIPYLQNVHDEFMKRVNEQRSEDGEELYKCSSWSFAKILHKNNYRYGRIQERDAVLFKGYYMERRKKYLERIAAFDADTEVDVYYQDETWIDPYSRCKKGWVRRKGFCSYTERQDFTFASAKIARGPRLIVLAVGGKNGFVPGTTEIYLVSKNKVQNDYHGNINGKKFYEWMEKVLQKLPRKSVIVYDNSPVHSVSTAPTSDKLKADFLHWLEDKVTHKTPGFELIPTNFREKTKEEMKQIVKTIKSQYPQYRCDDLIREKGHVALRLPPYQADLNPIELVWSDIKRKVRERNTEQNAKKTLEIAKEVVEQYTAQQWAKHVQHVKRLEQEYRDGDSAFQQMIDAQPIIEEQFNDVDLDLNAEENDDDAADAADC